MEAPLSQASASGTMRSSIDGDLLQHETDDSVVGVQDDLPELGEGAEPDPLVATASDRGG
ncbi:hypothetical protein SMF913_10147 [Streptomyces malaysiensis]|uniref:Uncharacterized protein n=1 Tax=Streptomyces malaysiensis TaxID=92644 RepID=A0A2J7Z1G5_STRMQ|nr:hypothetical protein SMF913_10147 [Streptomyces malaysiensis]